MKAGAKLGVSPRIPAQKVQVSDGTPSVTAPPKADGSRADAFSATPSASAAKGSDAAEFALHQAQTDAPQGTKVGLAMIAAKAEAIALPAWFPTDWDLDVAAQGAKQMLVAQGADPASIGRGLVDHVVFTDADHTLVNTSTPVLLRDAKTGNLVHHPKTGEIVALPSRGYQDAFEALKNEFPKRDWTAVGFDYSGMADAAELHRHEHIESTAEVLRENHDTGRGRQFIITARSADNIPAAFLDYAQERGVHLDGTFPVNGVRYADALDLTQHNLDTGARKAMTMAALMHLYAPKSGALETVRFYEDSDPNLRSAMELLPKLFPKTKFEFWDVIHNESGGFDAKLVAVNDGHHVVTPEGRRMSDAEIARYQSDDAPIADHTGPILFPTDDPARRG